MSIAQPSQLQEIGRPNPGVGQPGYNRLCGATSIQRATMSKPSPRSAGEWHPLASIVHRLKEPAFTLENRILSFFSRVDAFSTITGWRYIKNEDFEQS